MLPTSDLGPFLRPSLEVKYTTLSPNTSVADYLSRVNDQVLAEYNAFLSEVSFICSNVQSVQRLELSESWEDLLISY